MCVYSTRIKSHALTLTSVVVTFGWVTLQGMTSGCFSFRYNTSGLIPGWSTNGCWLSETQTLRSGTHMVLIISMSHKCINKDYLYIRVKTGLVSSLTLQKSKWTWPLDLSCGWQGYEIFIVYYTPGMQLVIILIIEKSAFHFIDENIVKNHRFSVDVFKCPNELHLQ